MRDISTLINAASLKSKDWTKEDAETMVQSLIEIPKVFLDWDKGDGETWARLLSEENVIAYVSVPMPIIICLDEYAEFILPKLATKTEFFIEVKDFEEHIFSIDPSLIPIIEQIFCCKWSNRINPQQFSINELWWSTV
jgi:hypothetical protein